MQKSLPTAALIFFSGIGQLSADSLSYDYLEVDLTSLQLDTADQSLEGDGYRFKYSREIGEQFFWSVDYESASYNDVLFFDITQDTFSAGAGYIYSLSWRLDAYAQLSYGWRQTDLKIGTESEGAATGKLGLRWIPFESFDDIEIEANYDYRPFADLMTGANTSSAANLNLRWHFNRALSLSVGAQVGSDSTVYLGSFRLSF